MIAKWDKVIYMPEEGKPYFILFKNSVYNCPRNCVYPQNSMTALLFENPNHISIKSILYKLKILYMVYNISGAEN